MIMTKLKQVLLPGLSDKDTGGFEDRRVSPAASGERASLRKLPKPSSFPRVLSNVSPFRVIYDGFRLILNYLFCWNDVIN